MRTTLDLPETLVNDVKKRTGARTKTTAIVIALREYVNQRRAVELARRLRGRVRFVIDPMEVRHLSTSGDRARRRLAR